MSAKSQVLLIAEWVLYLLSVWSGTDWQSPLKTFNNMSAVFLLFLLCVTSSSSLHSRRGSSGVTPVSHVTYRQSCHSVLVFGNKT